MRNEQTSMSTSERLLMADPGPTLHWRDCAPLIGPRRAEVDPFGRSRLPRAATHEFISMMNIRLLGFSRSALIGACLAEL
jgi:hypothetical protein